MTITKAPTLSLYFQLWAPLLILLEFAGAQLGADIEDPSRDNMNVEL